MAAHVLQYPEGSIIPVGYEQVQGDLEVADCCCGDTLYRGLRSGWHHAPGIDPRPCAGTNSNICVGEGCYGESCLRATS